MGRSKLPRPPFGWLRSKRRRIHKCRPLSSGWLSESVRRLRVQPNLEVRASNTDLPRRLHQIAASAATVRDTIGSDATGPYGSGPVGSTAVFGRAITSMNCRNRRGLLLTGMW
jgi:hypothetical protein